MKEKREIEVIRQRIKELKKENKNEEEIIRLLTEKEELEGIIYDEEQRLAKLEKEIHSIKENNHKKIGYQKSISDLESQIESLERWKAHYQGDISTSEEYMRISKWIKELQEENTKLKEINAIQVKINDLESQIEYLERWKVNFRGDSLISEEYIRVSKWIRELQDEVSKLKGSLPADIIEIEKNLAVLENTTKEQEIEELKRSLKSHRRKHNDILKQTESYKELEKLSRINSSYKNFVGTKAKRIVEKVTEVDKEFYELEESKQNEIIDKLIEGLKPAGKCQASFLLWDQHEKLTKEAKEEIKNKVKAILAKGKTTTKTASKPDGLVNSTQNIVKKDEKKWLKALAGTGGFVTGIGLSALVGTTPILGTAITIYAAGRTVYNLGKLSNNIITKLNKGKEPQIITKIKNKIPDKVKKAADKIFGKPKNPYARWFVNGVSLGYLADKVFDIHEKIGEAFTNRPTNSFVAVNNGATQGVTGKTSVDVPPHAAPVVEVPTLHPGDTIDLSSITHGYASSYGSGFTSLDTSRGVNAIFDKVNIVNGQEWYHFLQPNGAGYAWIPKEQIDELLQQAANVGRGMH